MVRVAASRIADVARIGGAKKVAENHIQESVAMENHFVV